MSTQPQNPYHNLLRMTYRMRRAQKQAKQTKTRTSILAAEAAERAVDQLLEAVGSQAAQVRQLQLVSDEGKAGS